MIGDPVASQSAIPGMSPYACSKIALEQFALQMNAELLVHGIKVHYFLPPPMETKFLKDQIKSYPPPTREIMKNTRKSSAGLAAKSFMNSISMNEFFIPGSFGISFLAALKAQFTLSYSICFGPLSFVMRMCDDMRV